MSQTQYAIMRFAKYKGPEISNIEAHNERTKEKYASNPDIDLSRSKHNFHLIEPAGRYRAEAENQIQAAGERSSCVLHTQGFHPVSRKGLICPHCFLKRAVLSELKRPLNLQIFHNIVMVDKMVRLGWYICFYLLCT